MLKFSQFQDLVTEWLKPHQKTKVNKWQKGDNDSTNAFFGGPDTDKKTHQRRYFDFEPDTESPTKDAIAAHIQPHGYEVHDYKAGLAKDKHGREVRIGKVLHKTNAPDEMKKSFENDSARSHKASSNYKILVTRHPHDVAGMTSCGHSWEDSSCMNFASGSNRHYLEKDVRYGTHVAYLVHSHDTKGEPKSPLARISIKRFSDGKGGHIYKPEPRLYGNAPKGFHDKVGEIMDTHHNDNIPTGVYDRKTTYNDGGGTRHVHVNKNDRETAAAHVDPDVRTAVAKHSKLSPGAIDTLMSHPQENNYNVLQALATRKDLQPHHIDKLHNASELTIRRLAAKHHPMTDEHIDNSLGEESDPTIAAHALSKPNVTPAHLSKAVDHSDSSVISAALKHPNIESEHVKKVYDRFKHKVDQNLDRGDDRVTIEDAIKHPKASDEIVNDAFSHPSGSLWKPAIESGRISHEKLATIAADPDNHKATSLVYAPNVTSDHLKTVLKRGDLTNSWINSIAKHPHLDSEGLHSVLNQKLRSTHDYGDDAIESVSSHPNATSEHLDKMIAHRSSRVRKYVLDSPHRTEKHLDALTQDSDENIRDAAFHAHPNPSHEQIVRAVNDPKPWIRRSALSHKDVNVSHLKAAADNPDVSDYEIHNHILDHPRADSSLVDHILQSPHSSPSVVATAIKSRHATSDHIDVALEHPDQGVRHAALSNPNASISHLQLGLEDDDRGVRNAAKRELRRRNYLVLEKKVIR
jgi:hypothetical protein